MLTFEFSSVLPEEYREDLETVLYFNRQQGRVRTAIVQSLEKYGQPRLDAADGFLRVSIEDVAGVQTLFALADLDDGYQLAGVVMYVREGDDLVIVHLAVAEAFSSGGPERDGLLAMRCVLAVQDIARRLKGVRSVVIYYPAGVRRRLRVGPTPLAGQGLERRSLSTVLHAR